MKKHTSKTIAKAIQKKKELAAIANQSDPLHKGTLNRSFYNTRKPSEFRNNLERRSIFKTKITRGVYASDAIVAKFGI